MIRRFLITGTVALVLLTVAFGFYGERINEAYGEAFKVRLHLAETNGELETLEKRVKELEDAREHDNQRLMALELAKKP
jgi:hypothetical protein